METDHRALLKRYMQLVKDIEGTSFVELNPGMTVRLTDDEISALEAIEAEINAE